MQSENVINIKLKFEGVILFVDNFYIKKNVTHYGTRRK